MCPCDLNTVGGVYNRQALGYRLTYIKKKYIYVLKIVGSVEGLQTKLGQIIVDYRAV